MEIQEIAENVDKEKLKRWLKTAGMPFLREPAFFEGMGFSRCFVRQFLRKHQSVLKPGGIVQRNIKGVKDTDFLDGLAEEMRIDTSKVAIRSSSCIRTIKIAQTCLQVLNEAGCKNDGNEYRTDGYAQEKASISQVPILALNEVSTCNFKDSEVNNMSNGQVPNSDNYKLENKLRRIAMFPMIMIIVVASIVAGILAIVILWKFFVFGLETYGLKFW